MPVSDEKIRALVKVVRDNLEDGIGDEDNPKTDPAGSPENPCCNSCVAIYNALVEVEAELDAPRTS